MIVSSTTRVCYCLMVLACVGKADEVWFRGSYNTHMVEVSALLPNQLTSASNKFLVLNQVTIKSYNACSKRDQSLKPITLQR
jgi:hypothetical protein